MDSKFVRNAHASLFVRPLKFVNMLEGSCSCLLLRFPVTDLHGLVKFLEWNRGHHPCKFQQLWTNATCRAIYSSGVGCKYKALFLSILSFGADEGTCSLHACTTLDQRYFQGPVLFFLCRVQTSGSSSPRSHSWSASGLIPCIFQARWTNATCRGMCSSSANTLPRKKVLGILGK